MTGGLWFLLVAVACSVIGSVVLWATSRQPTSTEHGIEEFSREMRALSPDPDRPPRTAPAPDVDQG